MSNSILTQVRLIAEMYKKGTFGNQKLPEDVNPGLGKSTEENALYFTLPTALNYRRNSYALWENAKKTYSDNQTNFVFFPKVVTATSYTEVQNSLVKYRLALQMNKQTDIWIKLCKTLVKDFGGSIYAFFDRFDNDVEKVRHYMQIEAKSDFPYISGKKLCNYWLFVMYQYTEIPLKNIDQIYIAADTHIIKASRKLGLITDKQQNSSKVQDIVIKAWSDLLKGTEFRPVDLQTPIWMWARSNFPEIG